MFYNNRTRKVCLIMIEQIFLFCRESNYYHAPKWNDLILVNQYTGKITAFNTHVPLWHEVRRGPDNSTHETSLAALLETWRAKQNGCLITNDIFKHILLIERICICIQISLTFVPKGPINNKSALAQVMSWRRPGDKPLPKPIMSWDNDDVQ